MNRNRKIRLALVLALAVVSAYFAWRTSQGQGKRPPCVPGRHEEKDASGTVVKITNTTCRAEAG
jgi:membrane protein implicated in regulation of membrane protease activity